MIKGVFIHPCVRSYRAGMLSAIAKKVELDVIESGKPKTGGHVANDRESAIANSSIKIVNRSSWSLPRISNSNLSIFQCLLPKYEFVIFSSFLSLPFLILSFPAKLLGKRVFVFDELWSYPDTKKYLLIKYFVKALGRAVIDGHILAGTKSCQFSEHFFGESMKRVVLLNTHSDYNGYDDVTARPRGRKLLYLGRIVKIKGLDVLIRAISYSSDLELTVVGDGPFRAKCEALVDELSLGARITFKGSCEHNEVSEYFNNHDVFVLPSRFLPDSHQQLESWGFTLNEALQHGCITVASDMVGGAHDLIIDGFNGYIFESENILNLCSVLAKSLLINTDRQAILNDLKCRFDNNKNAELLHDFISTDFSERGR